MPKGSLNVSLKGADDIFSTEESRQEQQREQVQQIPIGELFPFKNHPFKVLDDESMQRTVESVEQYGVLSPLIARPRPEGGYEIISGHRRQHATQLAGLDTLPVIVRNMDDDAAVLLMVDSNLQRETILPSERAFAYKMKLEAMKHQAGRPTQDNYSQVGNNFGTLSSEEMAEELGTSKNQIFRYIRLTNLVPELLDMVDEKKIAFNPAVELSYLDESQQRDFLEAMNDTQNAPSLSQAQRLKKLAQEGHFSYDVAFAVIHKMSFQDLHLHVSYESDSNKNRLLDEFYIPVLENSKKYFRIAGFFSSTSLSVAAEGIEGLIKNDGKKYLLISPELSEEDYSIISKSQNIEENCSIFSDFIMDTKDDHLKALAWLLDSGRLEIKIVVGKKSRNSLFHQKVGIFFDNDGNMLSFSGSINETAQAWINNIEEFKVFRSWNAGQVDYLQSDLQKFSAYWGNERKDTALVFDLPSSIKEKIIHIKPRDVWDLNIMRRYKKDSAIKKSKLSLFPHQAQAVEAWVKNGYSLLMEMATGTGKTRTAIGCLLRKLEDHETLLTIVATPQNTLSRQWKDDFTKLAIQLDYAEIIDGSVSKWPKKLELLLLDLNEQRIRTAIVFTTHATASDQKFVNIILNNKFQTKILFIADEVHATGSAKQRDALLQEYDYRIGLSATPERMFDENGTSLIRSYFGNKSFEFTISDALATINPLTGRPSLNHFLYCPIFVELTPSENKLYNKYSQQIAIMKAQDDYDPNDLQKLYDRRAAVSKNAEEKYEALNVLLEKLNPEKIVDTILFVSDKQIKKSFDILSDKHIKRAKITEQESASKIVNSGGDTERQEIISQFNHRQLQFLVGIKCLDEGIDIPNSKNKGFKKDGSNRFIVH